MKTSLSPLQTAIYNRLVNDAEFKARMTDGSGKVKLFDAVSEGQPFPYSTLGEDTSTDDSTKTFAQEEVTKTMHVWSKYKGKKEAQEIMSIMLEAITREPLALAGGFSVELSRLELMEVFEDNDGIIRHGVMRFRFKIKQ